MTIEEKISSLQLALPPLPTSKGVFKRCVIVGNLLYVSGHVSVNNDGGPITGKVGRDISDDDAKMAARQAGLSILTSIKEEIFDLQKITRVIKILGMVNCTPEYQKQPIIINGCSELYTQLWGDNHGKGVRSAIGVGSLPENAAVEIEAIFELNEK